MRMSLGFVLAFAAVLFASAAEVADGGIAISPNVINLSSQSEVVSVHTELPYSSVVAATVTLDGVEIDWWKMDNQGCFVAKFDSEDVKGILQSLNGPVDLTLSGELVDGETFSFTDTITVIDVKAGKR